MGLRNSVLSGISLIAIIGLLSIFIYQRDESVFGERGADLEVPIESSNPESLSNSGESPPRLVDSMPAEINEQVLSTSDFTISRAVQLANEGNTYQAARILAELYGQIDIFSDQDKALLLQNYADLLIRLGSNVEAIQVLEQLLAVPNLRVDSELVARKTLGETLMKQEEWLAAETQLNSWLDKSKVRDPEVLLNLSYTYYQRELWDEAIPPAIEHINRLMDSEQEITRERLMYINSLAFSAEDWENAAWLTQVMINQFDEPVDWRNLIAIYSAMGNEEARAQARADAIDAGKIDESGNLIRN